MNNLIALRCAPWIGGVVLLAISLLFSTPFVSSAAAQVASTTISTAAPGVAPDAQPAASEQNAADASSSDGESGDWPAGNAKNLLYRLVDTPMGTNDGVTLWVRGDGTSVSLRIRLMVVDADTSPDTVTARPTWISDPIPVRSTAWKEVFLPRWRFTLHRLDDAPDGIDPDLPPDAQAGIVPDSDGPSFSDVNAIAIEVNVPWHSTIAVDDIAWASFDSSGDVTDSRVIDDFETGDVAAWIPLGDTDVRNQMTYGLTTKPNWVHSGRLAFKMSVLSPAARRKSLELPAVDKILSVLNQSYAVFTPRSLFARVVPSTLPEPGHSSSSILVMACPGQIQAATFCLYTSRQMTGVTVSLPNDLQGAGHVIPSNAVDIHVVKVWNRLGTGEMRNPDDAGPTPELLVKDDRIDLNGMAPDIRLTGDVETDIPADSTKQFWLTISVPPNADPDVYGGDVVITADGMAPIRVHLGVRVLALRLLSPGMQYAIDLRSRLDQPPAQLPAPDGSAFVTDFVSSDMLAKQLQDIVLHGVRLITIHDPESTVWDAYNARKAAGFMGPYVYTGPSDPLQIESERAAQKAPEFIYFEDPGSGVSELEAVSSNNLPAATYIAHQTDYDTLQSYLDTVIYNRDSDYPQQLIRTHGQRTSTKHDWWYWTATDEDPHTNRYSAGLLLYRAHLYGAFLPAYQLCFGTDPYDDSSPGAPDAYARYRPEMLAYPAAGGVIDTLQWEAVREGITDERYITTMFSALRDCKDAHIEAPLVDEAQSFIDDFIDKPLALLDDTDYDAARAKIAGYALRLRTAVDAFNKAHSQ